jgi:16S rRNA (cytidine1402-2'-O)-methyltransferase
VSSLERPGRLVVVGTPIGNLEDLSPRGLRALSDADAIFCEDTRVTAKLAARFGLRAPRISCPAPRENTRIAELLERLGRGETIALVSDAGMPAMSDPGERLVAAAAEAGHVVEVVPGPSAPAAALSVSGLPAVPHVFLGFLPARQGERRRALEALRSRSETLVWFEAPHRLRESLADAAAILGPRRSCVARELTKHHEEVLRDSLDRLAATYEERGVGRGEITVIVEGASAATAAALAALSASDVDDHIREALAAGEALKSLSKELARRSGRPAREIYARALKLSKK